MMKWQYPLVPRFYNPVDEYDSFSRLIIINSMTASTHEQSATGICYLQNLRTLPDWIASRTDYQSITTNLCCTGTSSSLWYLWGTSVYSAEKKTETCGPDGLVKPKTYSNIDGQYTYPHRRKGHSHYVRCRTVLRKWPCHTLALFAVRQKCCRNRARLDFCGNTKMATHDAVCSINAIII